MKEPKINPDGSGALYGFTWGFCKDCIRKDCELRSTQERICGWYLAVDWGDDRRNW